MSWGDILVNAHYFSSECLPRPYGELIVTAGKKSPSQQLAPCEKDGGTIGTEEKLRERFSNPVEGDGNRGTHDQHAEIQGVEEANIAYMMQQSPSLDALQNTTRNSKYHEGGFNPTKSKPTVKYDAISEERSNISKTLKQGPTTKTVASKLGKTERSHTMRAVRGSVVSIGSTRSNFTRDDVSMRSEGSKQENPNTSKPEGTSRPWNYGTGGTPPSSLTSSKQHKIVNRPEKQIVKYEPSQGTNQPIVSTSRGHCSVNKCTSLTSTGKNYTNFTFLATSPYFCDVVLNSCMAGSGTNHMNQYINSLRKNNFPASFPRPFCIETPPIKTVHQSQISYSTSHVDQKRQPCQSQHRQTNEKNAGNKHCDGASVCAKRGGERQVVQRRSKYNNGAVKHPYHVVIQEKEQPAETPCKQSADSFSEVASLQKNLKMKRKSSAVGFNPRVMYSNERTREDSLAPPPVEANRKMGDSYARKFSAMSQELCEQIHNPMFKTFYQKNCVNKEFPQCPNSYTVGTCPEKERIYGVSQYR